MTEELKALGVELAKNYGLPYQIGPKVFRLCDAANGYTLASLETQGGVLKVTATAYLDEHPDLKHHLGNLADKRL